MIYRGKVDLKWINKIHCFWKSTDNDIFFAIFLFFFFFIFFLSFFLAKEMIHLNKNPLTLSWRRPLSYRHQSIDIETSPLICGANQWTGFYMITASVMKRLNSFRKDRFREFVVCNLIIRCLTFRYICTASGTRGYSKHFVLSKIYKIYFRLFMEAVNH